MLRAILIGPPGSGKSSVGKALSRELSTSFEDTDELIVEKTGRTIAEIFAQEGEAQFRAIEREVVLLALRSNIGVISLGGGAVLDPQVQKAIRESAAQVILLQIGLGNVLSRISNKSDRPLVAQDPERQWKELLAARAPIYESLATIVIPTDNKKPYEVARDLKSRMGLARE